MPDIDPEQAAAAATGGDGEQATMGDVDVSGESSPGPLDRLFDGDAPGPSVSELQGDYSMPQWAAIAGRGVLRVATGSGVPPIFEILLGGVLGVVRTNGDALPSPGDSGGSDSADVGDGDNVSMDDLEWEGDQ